MLEKIPSSDESQPTLQTDQLNDNQRSANNTNSEMTKHTATEPEPILLNNENLHKSIEPLCTEPSFNDKNLQKLQELEHTTTKHYIYFGKTNTTTGTWL